MKMYQAILFDLDGTLLPMDNDEFIKGYLSLLAKELTAYGYNSKELVSAMWKGVESMVKNNGVRYNNLEFWDTFASLMGERVYNDIPIFDEFYNNDFNKAISLTNPTHLAKEAVQLAKEKADKVILATNPFFPEVAVNARMEWAGLLPNDFHYITHYENSKFCKPNPKYYLEIAEKMGITPQKCLMVGNNTKEDIWAGQAAGFDTYLITDCIIKDGEAPKTKQGSFQNLVEFLEKL